MPRKASQGAPKEAGEAKSELAPTRRSGRAAAKLDKPETTSTRDATRSRRSSTAAQTAASITDSKTPKGRGSSRRESTSPAPETRRRSGRESAVEARVKSSRRSTSNVNYKESDGEDEVPSAKYDQNFESGEDVEESDSDEKSKPHGRSKSAKSPPKRRAAKAKPKGRGRRGRQSKKKESEDEEPETFDVSDDSVGEAKKPTVKISARQSRGRRSKTEVVEIDKEEPTTKRSRGRTSMNKEEAPKSRPSRNVNVKKYTEDDEEEVEKTTDKPESEQNEEEESSRKRKRTPSVEDANKRLKEDEDQDVEENKEHEDKSMEIEEKIDKSKEEPMDIDEGAAELAKGEENNPEGKCEDPVDKISEIPAERTEKIKEDKVEVKKYFAEKADSIDKAEDKSDHSANLNADVSQKVIDTKNDMPLDTKSKSEIVPEKDEESILQIEQAEVKEDRKDVPADDVVPDASNVQPQSTQNSSSAKKEREEEVVEESKPVEEVGSKPVSVISQPKETNLNSHNCSDNTSAVIHSTHEAVNSTPDAENESPSKDIPKSNGTHNDVQHSNSTPTENMPHDQYYSLPGRRYITNSKLSGTVKESIKGKAFGFVSYNLGTPGSEVLIQKEKLLNELNTLNAHVICLQQVAKPFFSAVLEPSLDALGFKGVFTQPDGSLKGMATFYKSSMFRLNGQSDISLRQLIDKELDTSPLEATDKNALKSQIRKCGNVLFTHFSAVIGSQPLTVANVQIPPTDLSIHSLQVSCLAREVVRINGGTNKPLLLGGEFNIAEKDASYQLLRDGYLSNDMIEELQKRKDIVLPEKENASLVNLLWKAFQHPSSNFCSCYTHVLGHEVVIPEGKSTSPDLLWFSSNNLHTVGVLDVLPDKLTDHHFSLKADIAFSV